VRFCEREREREIERERESWEIRVKGDRASFTRFGVFFSVKNMILGVK